LGIESGSLFQNPGRILNQKEEKDFFTILRKRMARCPMAYLVGTKSFMDFDFKVTPDVLIPRPETELLVEHAIRLIGDRAILGLDIGTGSGCIAISLAKYLPRFFMIAMDISRNALFIARENAQTHQVANRILLIEGDLFAPFVPSPIFDLIVSNPPYISEKEYSTLMPEIRNFEPSIALLAGDGLEYYRKILAQAHSYLKSSGLLLLEIGYGQAAALKEMMGNTWILQEVIQDYAGIERVLVLSRP
jgi:release factor glutamine methyltransferase